MVTGWREVAIKVLDTSQPIEPKWRYRNIQEVGGVTVVAWEMVAPKLVSRNGEPIVSHYEKIEKLTLADGREMYGCCWEGCVVVNERPNGHMALLGWHALTHEGRTRKVRSDKGGIRPRAVKPAKLPTAKASPAPKEPVLKTDLEAFAGWTFGELVDKLTEAIQKDKQQDSEIHRLELALQGAHETNENKIQDLLDERKDLRAEVARLDEALNGDAQAWADLADENKGLLKRLSELEAGAPRGKVPDIMPLKARIADLEAQLAKRQVENENLRRALAAMQVLQIP